MLVGTTGLASHTELYSQGVCRISSELYDYAYVLYIVQAQPVNPYQMAMEGCSSYRKEYSYIGESETM